MFRYKGILQLREVPDKQVILQMTGKRVTLAKGAPWTVSNANPITQAVIEILRRP